MDFCKVISKIFFVSLALSIGFCNTSIASCCAPPYVWGSVEYLYWWAQDSPISVPLITQNNNPSAFGILSEPGTKIIFGSGSNRNAFKFGDIGGGRLTIGGWIDEGYQYGMEGSVFDLPQSKNSFSASSVGGTIPIVNIPFFSTQSSVENVLVNRLPNTVLVSDTFKPSSFELNGLYNLHDQMHFPLVFLIGFRYVRITEDLELNDAIFNTPSFPNAIVNVNDDFLTKNNFYGFQIGARSNLVYSNLICDVTAKIALGENYQKLHCR